MLLFLVLVRAVRLLRIFRPALRDVITTLPVRRLVGIAARLLAVVARAALHLQILWSVLLVLVDVHSTSELRRVRRDIVGVCGHAVETSRAPPLTAPRAHPCRAGSQ